MWDRVVVPLQAVTSFVGVKAGARLPPSLKPRLFASLAPLARLLAHSPAPPTTFLHHADAYLSTVLPPGVLSDVLSSHVRSTIDALFSAEHDASVFASACALATTLDGVEWPLWDTALGAAVLTATARELSSSVTNGKSKASESAFDEAVASKRENSLVLLARLAESGRLKALVEKGGAHVVAWEKAVGALAEQAIKGWKAAFEEDRNVDEDKTHELLDVLAIVPFIPTRRDDILVLLADLATTVAAMPATEARVAYLSSAASPALVLGSTLAAFEATSSRLKSPSSSLQTLAASVESMIAHFAWHRRVMHGLSSLSLARLASDRSPEARKAVYDAILPNLLSEDSVLRRSSLEIAQTLYPATEAPVAADLIAKCIEVEDMPLTVQGAREKSMKVRKLGIVANSQLGKEGSTEELGPVLEIVLRYLTGASLLLCRTRSHEC